MGTQRVPSYQCTPTTTDEQDINAAKLSSKVLLYLYDALDMRQHVVDAFHYAVVCGEGFLRPWWNANGGEKLPLEPCPQCGTEPQAPGPQVCATCQTPFDAEQLYQGQVCLEALGPEQVYWKPGMRFHESPWHVVEAARDPEEIMALPGYLGGDLTPDAKGAGSFLDGQLSKSGGSADMVRVSEYLERPTTKTPEGRRLMIANNRLILKQERYPSTLSGNNGVEPCIQKITYFPTPNRDRDMGLVQHLIDPQRTLNDAVNKEIEWKNLSLFPKIITGPGGLKDTWTDEPGLLVRTKTGEQIQTVTPPDIANGLFRMYEQAIADMEEIASQRGVPSGVDAAKAISALIERDDMRRQFIIQALADFYSRVGRHLLYLVQEYYTEPRLLQIQGRRGLSYIPDFKGADLRGQFKVRVMPASIVPMTREAMEQKIMNLAQLGWIDKQDGLAAMDAGTLETLVETYELNLSAADRAINQMVAMGDPNLPGGSVPIAKSYQDHHVFIGVVTQWMLTEDFEQQPPQVQEAANAYIGQHQQFLAQAQAQEQAAQTAQAQAYGSANAAKPAVGKPMPSLPAA